MAKREMPIAAELRSGDLNKINRALDRIGGEAGREFTRKLASDNLSALLDAATEDIFSENRQEVTPENQTFDRVLLAIARLGDKGLDAFVSELLDRENEHLEAVLYAASCMFELLTPAYASEQGRIPEFCKEMHEAGKPVPAPYPEVEFSDDNLDQIKKAIIGVGRGAELFRDENFIDGALESLDIYRRTLPFLATK